MSNLPLSGAVEWAGPMAAQYAVVNAIHRLLEGVAEKGTVESRSTAAEPSTCADGARYLLPTSGLSGANWIGHEGQFATSMGANHANGWKFMNVAREGFELWVKDENIKIIHDGSGWTTNTASQIGVTPQDPGFGYAGDLASVIDEIIASIRNLEQFGGGGGGGGGYDEGIAFPDSPSLDDKFYRTDLDTLYFYDGTRWLSTEKFTLAFGGSSATATLATFICAVPHRGIHSLFIEDIQTVIFISAAGNWDVLVRWADSAGAATALASQNQTTSGTYTDANTVVNAVLSSNARNLQLVLQENSGSATCFGGATLTYRLVGV